MTHAARTCNVTNGSRSELMATFQAASWVSAPVWSHAPLTQPACTIICTALRCALHVSRWNWCGPATPTAGQFGILAPGWGKHVLKLIRRTNKTSHDHQPSPCCVRGSAGACRHLDACHAHLAGLAQPFPGEPRGTRPTHPSAILQLATSVNCDPMTSKC